MSNSGIDLTDVSKPLRTVSLKIIGHETEDSELFLKLLTSADQPSNLVELTIGVVPTNVKPTVEFMVCYSYGDYSNL